MDSLDQLQDIAAFVAVGELGSLARAGAQLGIPVVMVSKRLSALERWTGTKLTMRGGRSIRLTADGQIYFARAKPLVSAVHSVYAETVAAAASTQGRLVVSMPPDFGNSWISPLLGDFIRAHPAIELELDLCPEAVDPSVMRVDVAIRVGPVHEQFLIARPLGAIAQHVFAAPDYLAGAPALNRPQDLEAHACILLEKPPGGTTWTFSKSDEKVDVRVAGRLSTNQVQMAHQLVNQGHGIAALPVYPGAFSEAARTGVRVLADWQMASVPVYALLPSRLVSPKTKLFIDYLASALSFADVNAGGDASRRLSRT